MIWDSWGGGYEKHHHWDITTYSPLKANRRFKGTHRLHLQGRKISRAGLAQHLLSSFLFCLFFDPEDGGDVFLRNVEWISTDYTALYRRRQYFSVILYVSCARFNWWAERERRKIALMICVNNGTGLLKERPTHQRCQGDIPYSQQGPDVSVTRFHCETQDGTDSYTGIHNIRCTNKFATTAGGHRGLCLGFEVIHN
jgi:hypothetical protein